MNQIDCERCRRHPDRTGRLPVPLERCEFCGNNLCPECMESDTCRENQMGPHVLSHPND